MTTGKHGSGTSARRQTSVLTGAGSPAVFSPDGTVFVTGGREYSSVQLWNARPQQRLGALDGLTGAVSSVAAGTDGGLLATAS
ncbi:hypothetical protein [Streptomyces sp. NPDC017230]|uniref:hypothetical protein n=1 Tax=unclassified Streptomyces TaxID=2593676 RepID=UPI0037A30D1B